MNTREVIMKWIDSEHTDTSVLADDVVFTSMNTAEFAGIPPTNKQVRVPLCVVYEVEDDKIKRTRIYFEMPALFEQLGVEAS